MFYHKFIDNLFIFTSRFMNFILKNCFDENTIICVSYFYVLKYIRLVTIDAVHFACSLKRNRSVYYLMEIYKVHVYVLLKTITVPVIT